MRSFGKTRADCDCVYGKVARSLAQYGERERTGARSIGLLIKAQVADAPRTAPLSVPYTHLQTAIANCQVALLPYHDFYATASLDLQAGGVNRQSFNWR